MKEIFVLIACAILFSGCSIHYHYSSNTPTKTTSSTKGIFVNRELLKTPRKENYNVTAIIECPVDRKILYTTEYSSSIKQKNGTYVEVANEARGHVKDYAHTQTLISHSRWDFTAEFKKRIVGGKFIVKVGDSIVMSKDLTGRRVKIDYGFILP